MKCNLNILCQLPVNFMMKTNLNFCIFYCLFGIILFLSLPHGSEPQRHHSHLRHHINKEDLKPTLYSNEFAVEIAGGEEEANAIAKKHGFINLGQVGSLEGWYTFADRRIHKRSVELHDRSRNRLRSLQRDVILVERLRIYKRVKRDIFTRTSTHPNDPSWDEMWYMRCGDSNNSRCEYSMRITDAWRSGFNGRGAVVTILDDGIETLHPDLRANYDANASKDINDNDHDPTPRYNPSNENKHGTRCAGVVAASMNNHICCVGVAYGAKIGGVRMLDGDVTDRVEAASLTFANNHIDIYSASWGPDDDGMTVEGPGAMAKAAFKRGATHGRGGKGSIFVWASGNGGHNRDSCSCDGYINNIYTIAISSVSEFGLRPWYLESCASMLACTYSSGETNEGKIVTTDLRQSCTHSHTGTSASAPMAAGVIAMMLQANPDLTWRDVQHIIVRTSNPAGLLANDWAVNGAGFNVSHVFGFGLLDAAGVTHVAGTWARVPDQKECLTSPIRVSRPIEPRRDLNMSMHTRACYDKSNEVSYLEHVILRVTLSHPRRGSLQIFLTSPSGTVSTILEGRIYDRSKFGFKDWEFMTTHHWGENPMGVWELTIRDSPRQYRDPTRYGQLTEWSLIFYGTKQHPQPNYHFEDCEAFPQDHCHEECVGCCGVGPHKCRACRHVSTVQGNCVPSCSLSQFPDGPLRVCKPCWRTCRSCNAGGSHNCTSCSHGYSIVNGACVKICNQGYYLETTSGSCRRCDEKCKTCHGRSSRCTSCRDGFRFDRSTCLASCQPGTYFASTTIGCLPCNLSCMTCTRTATRCIRCADGFVRNRQRCTTNCPKGYYPDYQRKVCSECHRSCRACKGPRESDCTQCSPSQTLTMGRCQSTCEDDYNEGYRQNPCTIVLRFGWCRMDIFAPMCCRTCSFFNTDSLGLDDDPDAFLWGDNYEEEEEDSFTSDDNDQTSSPSAAPATTSSTVAVQATTDDDL